MPDTHDLNQAQFERESSEGIQRWVTDNLNGEVTAITRLERWRPQWRVDFTTPEGPATVLFRGNRPNAGDRNLRFEMEVMQVLEKNGINCRIFTAGLRRPRPSLWLGSKPRTASQA